jgi:L-ascorbate metabolism protein UlaG (beta-lactamase superfamily)
LKLLRPRVAIPIHWGALAPTWRRAGYPHQSSAAEDFRREAKDKAPEVEVRVLTAGETLEVASGPG